MMLNTVSLVVCCALPMVLALILMPWVIKLAERVGALDHPDGRKIHTHPIPRLGGLGIYASFFFSLILLNTFDPFVHLFDWLNPQQALMLVGALLIVMIVGVRDDLHPMKPGQKFVLQVVAATIIYFAGMRISTITNVFGSESIRLGYFDYPVTILWIVGITNAINLIDGLDGLASGVAMIAALTIFAISYIAGNIGTAAVALMLVGSLIGFLRYNFNPARVFLGDSGSLFLGFCLAILSMTSSTKGSTAFAIIVPILALGLPIMDTTLAMVRRVLHSLLPSPASSTSLIHKLHSIVVPDKDHIHHRLIAKGLSQRRAVLILYVVSCAFGLAAFAMQVSNNQTNSLIIGGIAVAAVVGVRTLQYREMAVLRNGMLLPLFESPLMQRNFFHGFLDLIFIVVAYCGAFLLSHHPVSQSTFDAHFFYSLFLASIIQLGVFFTCGLYRETLRLNGIGDILNIVRVVAQSVLVTGVVFTVLPADWIQMSFTGFVLNFYILLSLVAGIRISFQALNYLFQRERSAGRHALIYGAGMNGMLTLQKLLSDDGSNLIPVGFLDDDPSIEGKYVNGYPIFGGHWKLEGLIHKHNIERIIITDEATKPEIIRRIYAVAHEHGVVIRKSSIRLEHLQSRKKKHRLDDVFAYAGR